MPIPSQRKFLTTVLSFVAVCALPGCSATRESGSGSRVDAPPVTHDVILLPTEEFPYDAAMELAKILARDTGLKIRAALPVGTRDWVPFNGTQYDPNSLKDLSAAAIEQVKIHYGGTVFLLLTTRDLNSPGSGVRSLFSRNFHQDKLAVISAARRRYDSSGAKAKGEVVFGRLRKMALRTIALLYYEMPRSAVPDDLMFSPLMSVEALDAIQPVLKR